MPVKTKILQSKQPFKHLDTTTLEKLANIAKLKYYNRGDVILAAGQQDQKSAFLVYGKVDIRAADGRTRTVRHDQKEAGLALCNIKPRKHTVTADSHNTCIVWIKDRVLDVICSDNASKGISLAIVPDRRSEGRQEISSSADQTKTA